MTCGEDSPGGGRCPTCRGDGWITVAEHDPACPGEEQFCRGHCPVPMQVSCPDCSPPQPVTSTEGGEDPW